MSITPLTPTLTVTDVRTDALVASTTVLLDFAITWRLNGAGSLMVEVPLGDPVAAAMLAACGGPDGSGSTEVYELAFSLSGDLVDSRKLVESPQITLDTGSAGVREDGPDSYAGYDATGVDRVTFHNASPANVFYGAPGTIPSDTSISPRGLVINGYIFSYQKGIYRTIPGKGSWLGQYRLAFVPVLAPILANQVVSVDINADMISAATSAVMSQVAGLYLPGDTAPLGSRQHWVADSSDGALNLTGITRGIALGNVGTVSHVHFDATAGPVVADETTTAPILDPVTIAPNLGTIVAQASFIGGTSTHGLPEGGTVTALACLNTGRGESSVAWDSNLLIVGVSTGNEGGGVFYYPHDGALRPCSQALDVLDLCVDGATLYVATPHGIFTHSTDVLDPRDWTRVGTLAGRAIRVWSPASGVLYCITQGNGPGGDGVFRHPVRAGQTDGADIGYGGWGHVASPGTLVDAAGSDTAIYVVDQNDPATVQIVTTPATNPAQHSTTPDDSAITGLDYDPASGTLYVRTTAGASGLYALQNGSATMTSINNDGSLADDAGNPVQVTRIVPYRGALQGATVTLVALTDQGPYRSASTLGDKWAPLTRQSGVGDQTVSLFAAGQSQTLVGRVVTRCYAAAAASLFLSNSEGVWWFDLLAEPLDLGPFWMALAGQCGLSPYAPNDVGALGSVGQDDSPPTNNIELVGQPVPQKTAEPVAITDTGGSGRVVAIPATAAFPLPLNMVWARRLSEHSDWTYRLVDTASPAPYGAIAFGERTEIQCNALVGVITASQKLAKEVYRFLSQSARFQTEMRIPSYFTSTTSALRTLRPTMLASVTHSVSIVGTDGHTYVITSLVAAPRYVLEHTTHKGPGDSCLTDTLLGTRIQQKALAPGDMSDAVALSEAEIKQIKRFK